MEAWKPIADEIDWCEAMMKQEDRTEEMASFHNTLFTATAEKGSFQSPPSHESSNSADAPFAFNGGEAILPPDFFVQCKKWDLQMEEEDSTSELYITNDLDSGETRMAYTDMAERALLASRLDALASKYRSFVPSPEQKSTTIHPLIQSVYEIQEKYVRLILKLEEECRSLCRGLVYTYMGHSLSQSIPFCQDLEAAKCGRGTDSVLSSELHRKQAAITHMLSLKKQKCLENFGRHVEEEIGRFLARTSHATPRGLNEKPIADPEKTPFKLGPLKEWLAIPQNFLHPYPNSEEKEELAKLCGMTYKQVTDWFTNFRLRKWKQIILTEEDH